MKIALISIHIQKDSHAFPLACLCLKSAISHTKTVAKRTDVDILEYYLDTDIETIVNDISAKNYDMAGFSIYSWNKNMFRQIALRLQDKQIIVCAGGPEVTASSQEILDEMQLDFVIRGDGEDAFLETIQSFHDGTKVWENDRIIEKKALHENLFSPFYKTGISWGNYTGTLWELSRGCPYKCSFCFESKNETSVRSFPFKRIEKEFKSIQKSGISRVFVLDPTFNYDKNRAKKLLQLFIKSKTNIHFTIEIRVELLDEELISLFSLINCSLQAGLQSSDTYVLGHINRTFDKEKYTKNAFLLNKNNVVFGLDLIYGLPGQNLDSFKESLDYALSVTPNHLDIFPLSLLKGTQLYDKRVEFGFNYNKEAPYTVFSTPSMNTNDMHKATLLKKAVDILYNQSGAVGWFAIVLSVIPVKPSDFLFDFIVFHEKTGCSADGIDSIVLFIENTNIESDLKMVLVDLIKFHYAMKKSLLSGFSTANIQKINKSALLTKQYDMCKGTELLNLRYNPDTLCMIVPSTQTFENAEAYENSTPVHIFTTLNQSGLYNVIVYNSNGEINYIVLDKEFFDIIKNIHSGQVNKFNQDNADTLKDFLQFCLRSAIIREDLV